MKVMENEIIRKCSSRNRNQRRWGVEFPLDWVDELNMKNSNIQMVKTGNSIIITPIKTTKSKPIKEETTEEEDDIF